MARCETPKRRCAIYTRKSSEEGLEQEFNSLHAQREACEAYIRSQRHEGWVVIPTAYDDGGFSGGTIERPALQRLLAEIRANRVDVVVTYKVDRLTRALADFARLIEIFDRHEVSFVSVTQQFNTTTSMGRLTLNVLLSFAQFEREVTGERIRDKIAASKKKGMWMAATCRSGMTCRIASCSSIRPRPRRYAASSLFTWNSVACAGSRRPSIAAAGPPSAARRAPDGSGAAGRFRAATSTGSCPIPFTSAG